MKKTFLKYLIVSCLFFVVEHSKAQQGPPDPPGDPANGGNEVIGGGGAPIGNGISLLLTLGLLYGTHKFYKIYKKVSIEE